MGHGIAKSTELKKTMDGMGISPPCGYLMWTRAPFNIINIYCGSLNILFLLLAMLPLSK